MLGQARLEGFDLPEAGEVLALFTLCNPCTHKAQAPPLVPLAQPAFVAACALHKSVCRPSYALSLEVRFKCDGLAKPTRSDRIIYDQIR